jgi:uncharacterized membrane protein HdeD (DUF308 family)
MTATTATSATAMQTKQRPWWLTLITGVLLVIVGATMLWSNFGTKLETYAFLVFFIGFYWLIEGIFDIVYMFVDHTAWGWKLFIGIVSIIAGASILRYPLAAGVALPKIFVLVMGIWGLMYGIILLIMAFQGGGWGAGILGVLGIIFGIVLMVNYTAPGMGLAMIWTASVFALIGGVVMIVQSLRLRSA